MDGEKKRGRRERMRGSEGEAMEGIERGIREEVKEDGRGEVGMTEGKRQEGGVERRIGERRREGK